MTETRTSKTQSTWVIWLGEAATGRPPPMFLLKRQLPTSRPAGPGDAPLDEHLIQGQSLHHAVALDVSPLRPEGLALLVLPLRRDPHVPVVAPCFEAGLIQSPRRHGRGDSPEP